MENHSCIHFACHARQETDTPLKSGFALHDGQLELSRIIKQQLPGADLAFLSACQTSTGDEKLSEEAVHLAAGMLAAGYRGVIATMWSINDSHALKIAQDLYENLIGKQEKRLNGENAARALHRATQNLRRSLEWYVSLYLPNLISVVNVGDFQPDPMTIASRTYDLDLNTDTDHILPGSTDGGPNSAAATIEVQHSEIPSTELERLGKGVNLGTTKYTESNPRLFTRSSTVIQQSRIRPRPSQTRESIGWCSMTTNREGSDCPFFDLTYKPRVSLSEVMNLDHVRLRLDKRSVESTEGQNEDHQIFAISHADADSEPVPDEITPVET
ncbi:hypothetical protein GALMADRAFT_143180 [Galerina marginata CBS 339.88]|uniref:CHAT domain-containing protein n=1 Tax=Galerina marginata (strain CBS 339.88) TaxID=685588 RepID=A0A067SN32_GALM3|nr:hypothetical protein GALMADRAFT_143180 [Galerina marginata CBS 339.88]